MKRLLTRIFLGTALLFFPVALSAGTESVFPVGKAAAVAGSVKQLHTGQVKKQKIGKGSILMDRDLILTSKDSSAILALNDDSTIEMGEESRVEFLKPYALTQRGGNVRYVISKRNQEKGKEFTVVSDFAIIGVKGTIFTINDRPKEEYVDLSEGVVRLTAPKGKKFTIRVKDPATGKMVSKKVKSFTLKEGFRARFDGDAVKIVRVSGSANEENARERFDFVLLYEPDAQGYKCNITMGTDRYQLEKILTNEKNGCIFTLVGTPAVCTLGASDNRKTSRFDAEGDAKVKAYFEPNEPGKTGKAFYTCK